MLGLFPCFGSGIGFAKGAHGQRVVVQFFRAARNHIENEAERGQEFAAAGRGRGKDPLHV